MDTFITKCIQNGIIDCINSPSHDGNEQQQQQQQYLMDQIPSQAETNSIYKINNHKNNIFVDLNDIEMGQNSISKSLQNNVIVYLLALRNLDKKQSFKLASVWKSILRTKRISNFTKNDYDQSISSIEWMDYCNSLANCCKNFLTPRKDVYYDSTRSLGMICEFRSFMSLEDNFQILNSKNNNSESIQTTYLHQISLLKQLYICLYKMKLCGKNHALINVDDLRYMPFAQEISLFYQINLDSDDTLLEIVNSAYMILIEPSASMEHESFAFAEHCLYTLKQIHEECKKIEFVHSKTHPYQSLLSRHVEKTIKHIRSCMENNDTDEHIIVSLIQQETAK